MGCTGYRFKVRELPDTLTHSNIESARPTIFDLAVATHVRTITKKFVPSGRPETDLASQHGYLSKFLQSLRAHPSRLEAAQQRTDRLSELTWKLYGECDEIAALRCFSSKLGILNIQFRRASDHIKQGAVDNLMQDMLLNLTDGCYGILLNLEEQIKQSHQNHDLRSQEDWSKIVWGDDQISWRREALQVYCQGIEAMNTNITRFVHICFSTRLALSRILLAQSIRRRGYAEVHQLHTRYSTRQRRSVRPKPKS